MNAVGFSAVDAANRTEPVSEPWLNVLMLTKYERNGASSRYRSLQYLEHFRRSGIQCTVSPLFSAGYLDHKYDRGATSKYEATTAFFRRVWAVIRARRFDLVVLQYELIPYFPAVFERLLAASGVRYIVDYDDALFHQYDRHRSGFVRMLFAGKIAAVMRNSVAVVAGNDYLAGYACEAGASQVEVIPTVVDLSRYPSSTPVADADTFTIGWIGSPSTAKYLQLVAPALAQMGNSEATRIKLVGSGPVDIAGARTDIISWEEKTEVRAIGTFDVGLMPLSDEPWTRGKCGFKLIQYMACGLPTVASPVGVNQQIVSHGETGFLVKDTDSWVAALTTLRRDVQLRYRLGRAGRDKVEKQYCLEVTAPSWIALLREISGAD